MSITFIWDLDGTLIDSYDAILDAIQAAYEQAGLDFHRTAIRQYILQTSVKDLFQDILQEKGLDLNAAYSKDLEKRNKQLHLMLGAEEILAWTKKKGIENFIYTHKGSNAHRVLADLGIAPYFKEVLTSANGFKRKPHPEGINYLLEKYALDQETCYYIGDRPLDIDLAFNSGIQSINFCAYKPDFNRKMNRLEEIKKLL